MNTRPIPSEKLDALKGWPNPHAVDFEAKFDPAIDARVPRGSVCHLNANGLLALGCDDPSKNPMPLFVLWSNEDLVVNVPHPSPATTRRTFVPVNPTGVGMALVATGAYELVTTQFVPGDYLPNDKLTSPTSGDNAGRIAPGTLGTNVICGIVSRGVVDNGSGYDAIAFWPTVLPVYPS